MVKIRKVLFSTLLSAILLVIVSTSALAADVMEYEFTDAQPSASQTFSGGSIKGGTVAVTVQKIVVSSRTDVFFTVHNDTAGTASFFMTKPTMVVEGNQINTTTFAVDTDVVPSASRGFVYSFNTKINKDTVFDLTMSIFVSGGGLSQIITVEGIDLSRATESVKHNQGVFADSSGMFSGLFADMFQNFQDPYQSLFSGYFTLFLVFIIIGFLLNAIISVAVYFDAKKNDINPALVWALVSFVGSALVLIIYLVVRYFTIRDRYAHENYRSSPNSAPPGGGWNPQTQSNDASTGNQDSKTNNHSSYNPEPGKFCANCGFGAEPGNLQGDSAQWHQRLSREQQQQMQETARQTNETAIRLHQQATDEAVRLHQQAASEAVRFHQQATDEAVMVHYDMVNQNMINQQMHETAMMSQSFNNPF